MARALTAYHCRGFSESPFGGGGAEAVAGASVGKASGFWQKYKTQRTDGFIVGGYVAGTNGIDELVVGRREGKQLMFVDSVKNGFVGEMRRRMLEAIERLRIDECPFANLPEKKGGHRMDREEMEEVRWVKPRVIVEVAFNEVTVHGHLRHSKFLRLRGREDAR